eukprot:9418068-Alexandrium_andersonii.AAC.1
MCITKPHSIPRAATEQVLRKKRCGRNVSNMSAVVTSEANRAATRVTSRPNEALEPFLAYRDALGRTIDEDCAN